MKDENTIKLIEKSEEIVQNWEWDRKYDYKLKNMRDKMRRPNIYVYQSLSNIKMRE